MLALCAAAAAQPVGVGDRIALRSHHSTYRVAEITGEANADRPAVGGWEQFTVLTGAGHYGPALPIDRGDTIALQPEVDEDGAVALGRHRPRRPR